MPNENDNDDLQKVNRALAGDGEANKHLENDHIANAREAAPEWAQDLIDDLEENTRRIKQAEQAVERRKRRKREAAKKALKKAVPTVEANTRKIARLAQLEGTDLETGAKKNGHDRDVRGKFADEWADTLGVDDS